MTRVNIGVFPEELCDQHLIAEYRELPRLWSFKPKSRPPKQFTLGQGHVLWCSQYLGLLAERYKDIVAEMRYRGFKVNYPEPPEWAYRKSFPSREEVSFARKIVLERLNERLKTMKRKPTWTRRRIHNGTN